MLWEPANDSTPQGLGNGGRSSSVPENAQSWQIPLDQRSWEKHSKHFSGWSKKKKKKIQGEAAQRGKTPLKGSRCHAKHLVSVHLRNLTCCVSLFSGTTYETWTYSKSATFLKVSNFIRLVLGVLRASHWNIALRCSDETFLSKVWSTQLRSTARCCAIVFEARVHRVRVEMAWNKSLKQTSGAGVPG